MLSRHSLQRIAHFNSKIICNKVSSLSLFCDLQMLLTVHFVMKDPDHALCGELERLPHASAPWYAKPTGEGTRLSPQQFDSSTGHSQPFVPAELICILYLGCIV